MANIRLCLFRFIRDHSDSFLINCGPSGADRWFLCVGLRASKMSQRRCKNSFGMHKPLHATELLHSVKAGAVLAPRCALSRLSRDKLTLFATKH